MSQANLMMAAVAILRGLTRSIPVWAAGFILVSALNQAVEVPYVFSQGISLLFIFGGFFLLLNSFFPLKNFSVKEKSKNLSSRKELNGKLRSDDLFLAYQFSSGPLKSSALTQSYLSNVENVLKQCRLRWCFPKWTWKRPLTLMFLSIATVGILLFSFPAHFLNDPGLFLPLSNQNLDGFFKVEPGDASVPYGSDVSVKIKFLVKSIHQPQFYVRLGGRWQAMDPTEESLEGNIYLIKNVIQPVVYRVLWKKKSGRKYTLTPVEPLQISRFEIEIKPPTYLKKGGTTQTSPEIGGLLGSQVVMDVETTVPFKVAFLRFSDGGTVGADSIINNKARFHFNIEKETTYSFEGKDLNEADQSSEKRYPIHLTEDHVPSIQLLSPDQDLVVGENEKIPLTFEAKDDFGLSEVNIEIEQNNRPIKSDRLIVFPEPIETKFETVIWDLARYGYRSGDVLRYRLEVRDSNSLTGPGKGVTAWRYIEIASFEKEHQAIEDALEVWREKLVDLLAEVNNIKAQTDDPKGTDQPADSFNESAKKSETLEKILQKIVGGMENDPFTDYSVWMEHKSMESSMADVNRRTVHNIRSAFQTQNREAASRELEKMSSELERMMALSEDLSKAQRAKDVLDAGERLKEIGEDLKKSLDGENIDPSLLKRIQEQISEAQKNLEKMARSLQSMPELLPEDFVNQAALKDVDVGGTKDILSQISEALKNGDTKRALQLATEFLAATEKMAQNLTEAHEDYLKSRSMAELEKEIEIQKKALEKITREQNELLSKTQGVESRLWEKLLKEQADLLSVLLIRQKNATKDAHGILSRKELPAYAQGQWGVQINNMEVVTGEFEARQLDKTMELLPKIISQSGNISLDLKKSSGTMSMAVEFEKVEKEEAYIFEQLNKFMSLTPGMSKEVQDQLKELSQAQKSLSQKTLDVQKGFQSLSRKTAMLNSALLESLYSAEQEMNEAVKKLDLTEGKRALEHQEKALSDLLNTQAGLEQAQMGLSAMAEALIGGGGGGGRFQAISRSGGPGSSGSKSEKVRLPGAKDYRPPKEFREDLLEALKEKYPKIYEDIIHRYYKRLVQ